LRDLIQRGLYGDNFRAIADLARDAALSVDRPLPFLVLWCIFDALHNAWEERPLRVEVARRMSDTLVPPIDSYLAASETGLSPELEAEHLNEIARHFLAWLEIQKDLPWS
jgi:hypothetical protein